MDSYILFIDSGIGGISILKKLIEKEDKLNIIYYADTKNFPYGLKDEKTIGNYLIDIYNYLKEFYTIKLIVIACNTASVTALQFLRGKIDIPIIGTVPAIKVAAEITRKNRIGVIATETTVKQGYISNLIKSFASGKEVFVKPASKLVEAVENFYDEQQMKEILEDELTYFKTKDIDTLVLGCTHYSFLYDKISCFFENNVNVIDSREGVTKRIINLMPKSVRNQDLCNIKLYISSSEKEIYNKYNRLQEKMKIFNEIIIRK